jgi:hypothetical protein
MNPYELIASICFKFFQVIALPKLSAKESQSKSAEALERWRPAIVA